MNSNPATPLQVVPTDEGALVLLPHGWTLDVARLEVVRRHSRGRYGFFFTSSSSSSRHSSSLAIAARPCEIHE